MDMKLAEQAATLLGAARLKRARLNALSERLRPSDQMDAYALQDVLHRHLARASYGDLTGYKIGCTTPVMQRYLDIPSPCAGGVFEPTVHHSSGAFHHGDLLRPGVECEIAVRLASDLPQTGTAYDRESVAPAVEAVMAAIEIVDDRWTDYRSVDTPTLIADDFFGAGCVLAHPVMDWRSIDLSGVVGSMSINGEVAGKGAGRDILGHPLEALAWLANLMTGRGLGLKAGEFVLLGSIVETYWVEVGDVVAIETRASVTRQRVSSNARSFISKACD